jgi:outer membrane protein assembly factor BamB
MSFRHYARHSTWIVVFAMASGGCGARTPLDGFAARLGDAGLSQVDGRGADGPLPADAAGRELGSNIDAGDPCASAVLASAGLPTYANCSTRDWRSRVVGPRAPHWTWRTPLSGSDSFALGNLAADASGNVYVAYRASTRTPTTLLVRIDGSTGLVDWAAPCGLSFETASLYLGPTGTVDAIGDVAETLDTFNPATGAPASHTLPPLVTELSGFPAVGSDGSLYVDYSTGASAISRVRPDGTVVWTTASLAITGTLTLGVNDLVLGHTGTLTVALDPATGALLWMKDLPGGLNGTVAVAPDGSIVVPGSTVYVLESTGSIRHAIAVGPGNGAIRAITREGTILVGGTDLVAVSSAGRIAWTIPNAPFGLGMLTVDETGLIFAETDSSVEGLDIATGATLWKLDVANAVPLLGMTLTSAGGIVVLGSDAGQAVVLGASD